MTIKAEVKTMALKNLYDMAKADRYTQDGREAIIKAQEEETEDATIRSGTTTTWKMPLHVFSPETQESA